MRYELKKTVMDTIHIRFARIDYKPPRLRAWAILINND